MRTISKLSLVGMLMVAAVGAEGQEASLKQQTSPKQAAVVARSKDGKKLFGAEDMLRIGRVSAPRISPDGARVAYLVSAVTNGKEGDAAEKGGASGKFVSQLWVVPTAGPRTRHDNSLAGRRVLRMRSGPRMEWSWHLRRKARRKRMRNPRCGFCTPMVEKRGR